ncbi:MAG: hypothetical protein K2I33_00905 [Oscillospiraceae bacterium]|nr:hypothetical protein [Oscillospiraceae bacterium]
MKRKLLIILFIVISIACGCTEKTENSKTDSMGAVTLGIQTIEQLQVLETSDKDLKNIDSDYNPLNFENHKAVWLTMMDYENILKGKNKHEFT